MGTDHVFSAAIHNEPWSVPIISPELNGLPLVNNAVGEKWVKQRAERDSVMQHGVGVAAAIMLKKDAPKDDMGERLLDASVELPANGNARLIILIGQALGVRVKTPGKNKSFYSVPIVFLHRNKS